MPASAEAAACVLVCGGTLKLIAGTVFWSEAVWWWLHCTAEPPLRPMSPCGVSPSLESRVQQFGHQCTYIDIHNIP